MRVYKFCFFIFLLAPLGVMGQDYFEKFTELRIANDTVNQRILLTEWEQEEPECAELFTSYFNYYFYRSQISGIGFDHKPEGKFSLSVLDSTDRPIGFLVDRIFYKDSLFAKSMEYINQGIQEYPARLDMRFGKTYALGQYEKWEAFSSEIIRAVEYSSLIDNHWKWTLNVPVENPKDFFLGSIQSYQNQLYNTQDDSLLKYIRNIGEAVLKYYPNHVESMSNVALTYIILGDNVKGIEYLLQAEKVDSTDAYVLNNLANAYSNLKDKDQAIFYYEKTIRYATGELKKHAEIQIKKIETKQ